MLTTFRNFVENKSEERMYREFNTHKTIKTREAVETYLTRFSKWMKEQTP